MFGLIRVSMEIHDAFLFFYVTMSEVQHHCPTPIIISGINYVILLV